MQHMLKVQWHFILIPWKSNGSFARPVPWLLCQPHPRTHLSVESHWSWITQSGINGDKQSKIKFLLCDKWNCWNCSSYIFHYILRLILQRRPKQFGLLTAVVAGLTFFAFIVPSKDIQVTQTLFYMAELLKALSSGFTGSGGTHFPRRERVWVCAAHLQELQRCPDVQCYRDAHIPENKVPFHVLPHTLGLENIDFTELSFQVSKSQMKFFCAS